MRVACTTNCGVHHQYVACTTNMWHLFRPTPKHHGVLREISVGGRTKIGEEAVLEKFECSCRQVGRENVYFAAKHDFGRLALGRFRAAVGFHSFVLHFAFGCCKYVTQRNSKPQGVF